MKNMIRRGKTLWKAAIFALLFSPFALHRAEAAPNLTVGTASGQPGTSVSVPVTFDPTTNTVGGIQFTITLPAGASAGTVTPGAAVTNAGKSISTNLIGNSWIVIIFGLNQTPIASGSLFTVQMAIAPGTSVGTLALPLSSVVYTDPNGTSIVPGTNTNGSITVLPPSPVITASTAAATVNTPFSYRIAATNSPTSYTAAPLPAGITFNSATGTFGGTPTTAGVTNVALSATNAGGSGTGTLVITVNPPAPVITSAGAATGRTGASFSYQITATNSPTSFNATGLPAGLSINTASGLITGAPTTAAASNISLSATNAGGTGTRNLVLTVLSACDVNSDSATNVADVQVEVLQAIFLNACTNDINQDGSCNVIDVQRIVVAALGGACVAP